MPASFREYRKNTCDQGTPGTPGTSLAGTSGYSDAAPPAERAFRHATEQTLMVH